MTQAHLRWSYAGLCKKALIALPVLAFLGSRVQTAQAATFNVASSNVTALKTAINTANSNGVDDTINLAAGSYILTAVDNTTNGDNGLPTLKSDGGHRLTINGNNATITRNASTQTAPLFRLILIEGGANVTLNSLTLSNGDSFSGGAIYNNGSVLNATLVLNRCTVTSNHASGAAAISNDRGTLTLSNCLVTSNRSDSGIITSYGVGSRSAALTLSNSTLSNNFTFGNGGGIFNVASNLGRATVSLSNCTFSGNVADLGGGVCNIAQGGVATVSLNRCTLNDNAADNAGGAIYNESGVINEVQGEPPGTATLSLTNCTIAKNLVKLSSTTAPVYNRGYGGGIFNYAQHDSRSPLTLTHCTLSGNSTLSPASGGGIYNDKFDTGVATVRTGNSIFANSTGNLTNNTGTIISQGYNLSSDNGGGFLTAAGDRINTNPLLDPNGLQANGGLTRTIRPQPGSPAIDKGKSGLIVDQRGNLRPIDNPSVPNAASGNASDIGAFEVQLSPTSPPGPGPILSSLVLNPVSVIGGNTSQGTVRLNSAAPASGASVTLSSSSTSASVPASVTIPAGAISATFSIATNAVTASTAAGIAASFNNTTKFASLSVNPIPPPTLISLSLSPTSVTGGNLSQGTVRLSGAAPSGGAVVTLSSSNTAIATVPVRVTVIAGAISATFSVATRTVTGSSNAVTISATYGGVTRTATLTVLPAPSTDTVAITRADYTASKQELRVEATSSSSNATLRVYVTATNTLIGTLTNEGGGSYDGQFSWPSNPGNVTIRSSLGGSASRAVTLK